MRRAFLFVAMLAACACGAAPARAAEPITPQVSTAEIVAAVKSGGATAPQKLRRARPAWFSRRVERRLTRDRVPGVQRSPGVGGETASGARCRRKTGLHPEQDGAPASQ